MILEIKNSLGVFEPLDLFEDFEIKYNHQYEDYDTIGGNKIPYTNKFKIPQTKRNRNLCGVPFDVTYPAAQSLDGRASYSDGSVAFYFITDIERQVVNVLEPYIEISIIDLISKAISDLNKFKMSELMANVEFDLGKDNYVFGDQAGLTTDDKYFLFPFINFNNKSTIFAYDAKRGINQLQPTFVVGKLIKNIFNHVGITVGSDFLNLNDQIASGIRANELGLTIPCDLMTNTQDVISNVESGFAVTTILTTVPNRMLTSVSTERLIGVGTSFPCSTRIAPDLWFNPPTTVSATLNYDWITTKLVDSLIPSTAMEGKFCSMVDGIIDITFKSNNKALKPRVWLGELNNEAQGLSGLTLMRKITSVTTSPPTLAVKAVISDYIRSEVATSLGSHQEISTSYDSTQAKRIGTANYIGVTANGASQLLEYEIVIDDNITIDFDVKANQDIEIGLILTPETEGTTEEINYLIDDNYGDEYSVKCIISDDYIQYNIITNASPDYPDAYWDIHTGYWGYPSGVNRQQFTMSMAVRTPHAIPSGLNATDSLFVNNYIYTANSLVNMGESMKTIKDYTLLEVVKMVMNRFNLRLFTKSNGTIYVDSYKNMLSGENLIIDHLIDEGIDVEFKINQNGILSMRDDNPSFYDENFNKLDKYIVEQERRDEIQFNFLSSISSQKMFEDTYDNSGYDLLKWKNSTNFWGVADRKQVLSNELKPFFSFIQDGKSVPVWFPMNECTYGRPYTNTQYPDDEYNVGFYNHFEHVDSEHAVLKTEISNIHESTGFKLVSFIDNNLVIGNDNLYKKTWYSSIKDQMDKEAVNVSIEIYVDEINVKKLMDFPTVIYKSKEWLFKGFNGFPLHTANGGVCSINLIEKKEWITDVNPDNVTGFVAVENAPSIDLSWNAATPSGSIDYYRLERRVGIGTYELLVIGGVNGISYTDTDIIDGNEYTYRIVAVSFTGFWSPTWAYSDIISINSTIPNDVTNVTTWANYVTQLPSNNVNWSYDNSIPRQDFVVEFSVNGGAYTSLVTTTYFTINHLNVTVGSNYQYRVKARNSYLVLSANWALSNVLTV